MNRNNFPALFSYEKLTDNEQISINHILQRLAEYNTMYEQMCSCKEKNTKLLEQLEEERNKNKTAIEYIKNTQFMGFRHGKSIISNFLNELLEILGEENKWNI